MLEKEGKSIKGTSRKAEEAKSHPFILVFATAHPEAPQTIPWFPERFHHPAGRAFPAPFGDPPRVGCWTLPPTFRLWARMICIEQISLPGRKKSLIHCALTKSLYQDFYVMESHFAESRDFHRKNKVSNCYLTFLSFSSLTSKCSQSCFLAVWYLEKIEHSFSY